MKILLLYSLKVIVVVSKHTSSNLKKISSPLFIPLVTTLPWCSIKWHFFPTVGGKPHPWIHLRHLGPKFLNSVSQFGFHLFQRFIKQRCTGTKEYKTWKWNAFCYFLNFEWDLDFCLILLLPCRWQMSYVTND